ncbi:group II truncated hemoglobin [Thalassotalea sp. 1_MG-2023]|uniref:group II truncated hemoglobin n=1 Tax=Thalassotalea sp. 1_MG-2023 TaxID=3062680 RepID=UPI0026E35536|nr:group II truncated hemoglobin [Thalassotalea sp. 1_MG-2023]MDO6427611.1 group II truncated hemoglobin [Thalassotalea sp. 1_MG-2023]
MLGIKKLLSQTNKSKMLSPSNTPYMLIGEAKGTKALANAFYDEMESNIHLQELLAIHKQPLDDIREKFSQYLSGWLGGPPLYETKYGHPRLRQRHMHVAVTKKQAELWMLCMNNAMEKTIENDALKKHLHQAFKQLALHMVNQ